MRPPKHRWTVRDARAHIQHAIDQLTWLLENIDKVFWRAERDSDNGLRGKGDGRSASADPDGANNGPTPRVALARLDRTDDVALAVNGLLGGLGVLSASVLRMRRQAAFLMGLSFDDAQRLVESPERGAFCDNKHCGRWVARTTADPIRRGRCSTCAEYHRTHEGKDRRVKRGAEDAA